MNTGTFHTETLTMKAFDFTILGAAFVFNTLLLGLDWEYVAIAAGGSFSGAIILAYFRRDDRKGEQIFKTLCAAIAGIVTGAAVEEWFDLTNPKATIGLFFMSGLLSLAMLRALLNLTEKNAAEISRSMLQRIFNLKVEEDRRRKRRREHVTNETKKEGE